jgi:hypothetical protein
LKNGKPYEPSQNYKKLHYDEEGEDDEEIAIIKPTWYHAVPTMHTAIVEYIYNRGANAVLFYD